MFDPAAPKAIVLPAITVDKAPPQPSEGCKTPRPAPRVTLDVAGTPRTVNVVLPPGYDPARPYPLVLAFHGSGWKGTDFMGQLHLYEGHEGEVIALYPDAVVRHIWGDEHATHWGRVDDLPFFDALVAFAKRSTCIDERRIFAVGWSSGGYFANQLACVRPSVVRASASLSGGGPEQATCTTPMPLFIHHGRNDNQVMVTEGRFSRDHWRKVNGCTAAPSPVDGCVRFEGCKAPLVYCETDHTGHSMPPSVRAGVYGFFSSF